VPWPTYSERFLHHSAAGRWVFTVPADMRMVVTSLDAVCLVEGGASFSLTLGPIALENRQVPVYGSAVHATMRAVGYQGEQLALNIPFTGMHVTVSGYLLADSSGRTGPPPAAATKPDQPERPVPEPVT
jgi:hypothetical protein